jgi:NADH:ubiquinone oxidoreductase subunit 6 (subunit J)
MLSLLAADPPANWFIGLLTGLADQWPLWLPLIAGALAVYLLLPRPRAYPVLWGIAAGAAALVLGGGLLVHATAVWQETVLFYVFSGSAIVAGALLVTQRNPARAALSFALVILATCGLFLLLAAPFLMAATIIIYAGAIVVTFLFVLMLAQQQGLSDADARSREPLLGTLTGFVLLGALLYVIRTGTDPTRVAELDSALTAVRAAQKGEPAGEGKSDPVEATRAALSNWGFSDLREQVPFDATGTGEELARLEQLLKEARRRAVDRLALAPPPQGVPMSDLSGPAANTPAEDIRRNTETGIPESPAENAAYLGRSLFTDFLLPVELGGFLLLVATIGAIAIGQRREPTGVPTQSRATIPGSSDQAATGVMGRGRTV